MVGSGLGVGATVAGVVVFFMRGVLAGTVGGPDLKPGNPQLTCLLWIREVAIRRGDR